MNLLRTTAAVLLAIVGLAFIFAVLLVLAVPALLFHKPSLRSFMESLARF